MNNPVDQPKVSELLPCPFCGSSARIFHRDNGFWGYCVNDDCTAETMGKPTREEAAAAWNHRAPQATTVGVTSRELWALGVAVDRLRESNLVEYHNEADILNALRVRFEPSPPALIGIPGAEKDGWVLIKRGLYWRPNAAGYTSNLAQAGVYSDEDSAARCDNPDVTRKTYAEAALTAPPAPTSERVQALESALRPFANMLPDSYSTRDALQAKLQEWCRAARAALLHEGQG